MGRRGRPIKVSVPKLTEFEAIDPPKHEENSVAAKLWAKAAWFSGRYTNQELADLVDVNINTMQLWIKGHNKRSGWLYEKEKYEKKAIKSSVVNNSNRMDKILTSMLEVFEKGIKELKDSNASLSVQDMSALSTSFDRLFKARQLSIGAPTDIFLDGSGKALSWNQIKEEIMAVDILDYSEPTVAKMDRRSTSFIENCKDTTK